MVWKIGLLNVWGSGIGHWGVKVLWESIGLVIIYISAGYGPVSSGYIVLFKGLYCIIMEFLSIGGSIVLIVSAQYFQMFWGVSRV